MAITDYMTTMVTSEEYDDLRDVVDEALDSYERIGIALTELLIFFSGTHGFDNEAASLIERMFRAYLAEI